MYAQHKGNVQKDKTLVMAQSIANCNRVKFCQ